METSFGSNLLTKKKFIFFNKKKKIDSSNRLFNKELGGGCILDLGCYTTSFSLLIASLVKNIKYKNFILKNVKKKIGSTGIDIHAEGDLIFEGGFTSKIKADVKKSIVLDSKIHTITHVLVNASKILTKSESNDIDAYYENGVIHLFDNTSDGYNGCSKMIYDDFENIMNVCFDLVNECDCPTDEKQKKEVLQGGEWGGCPKCTFTTNYCQTKNKKLSKKDALEFFSIFKKDKK